MFSGVDAAILVSASGDGELARLFLERLGYETLRGSTGKVEASALTHLRVTLESGRAIAITPDGPRGPRHRVNRGAAFLARATGTPILPIGFAASRALRLRSWFRNAQMRETLSRTVGAATAYDAGTFESSCMRTVRDW